MSKREIGNRASTYETVWQDEVDSNLKVYQKDRGRGVAYP